VTGVLLAVALMLAQLTALPTAPPDIPPLHPRPTPPPVVAPATMLARYAEALEANATPDVLTFDYTLDQTGSHDLEETHRVFRSGTSERDELLSTDGKKLDPPAIRIYLGRRNRYAMETLAPRPEAYTFRYIGSVRDGHHQNQVFATTPRSPGASAVVQVTIDGITALPVAVHFATRAHKGTGSVVFGRVQKYWVPVTATATATVGKTMTIERLGFSHYRFPQTLAPSTFARPRPLPTFSSAP
jgi:hypothetical protein